MSFPDFLRTRWAALRPAMAQVLRRPEKLLSLHSLLWALMAAGLALVLYVLVLIPFTPGIRDIRKAKTEQSAQLVAADGKLYARCGDGQCLRVLAAELNGRPLTAHELERQSIPLG